MRAAYLLRLGFLLGSSLMFAGATSACGDDESGGGGSGNSGNTGTGGTGASATGGTGATATGGNGGTGTGGTGGIPIPGNLNCDPPMGEIPDLALTEVASGLFQPVLVRSPPNDPTRAMILQKDGVVRLLRNGQLEATPFVDISALVGTGGGNDERGLLGIAFHPDYENNRRFFLHYTRSDSSPDGRIAEFAANADFDTASPTPTTIFDVNQPQGNHNGGSIEFSPADGFLYIALGDGGGADDTHCNGQNLNSPLGKILRIDVDSQQPYAIPAGNFDGGLPEIWDYGVRNPWRVSFDLCTGDLYIADVGQNQYEEVNVEPAGMGSNNYGWPAVEGMHCFGNPPTNDSDCTSNNVTIPECNGDPPMVSVPTVMPVAEYPHSQGCSISGGHVYRGDAIPGLRGHYLYGDFCSGRVWAFEWTGGAVTPEEITANIGTGGTSITAFGQDANGEIYLCDQGGSVYRIDPG